MSPSTYCALNLLATMWNARLFFAIWGRDGDSFVIRISSFANALKQMPELRSFCFEILFVMRIGFGPDRHLFDHFETVALEANNFLRVICKEPELPDTEVKKDLCAESVIAQVARIPESCVRLDGIESFLLQFVCMDFCRQPDTTTFLPHVNQNTLAFLLDLPQGRVQLISAVASARSKNIAGETLAVHAHEDGPVFV